MVCHLEQVHCRHTVLEQRGVDVFLDVAHQQEPPLPDLAEQDDRDVVDAGPAVWRGRRHLAADRPEHADVDLVHGQAISRGEPQPCRRPGSCEFAQPGTVTGSRTAHARFEDASDAIPLEEQREPGDVVLVRVTQDDRVDAPVPRRDAPIQFDQQPAGVRPTVDQESATP